MDELSQSVTSAGSRRYSVKTMPGWRILPAISCSTNYPWAQLPPGGQSLAGACGGLHPPFLPEQPPLSVSHPLPLMEDDFHMASNSARLMAWEEYMIVDQENDDNVPASFSSPLAAVIMPMLKHKKAMAYVQPSGKTKCCRGYPGYRFIIIIIRHRQWWVRHTVSPGLSGPVGPTQWLLS